MKLTRHCIVTLLIIIFSLTSCSQRQSSETNMALYDIVTSITESQSELPPFQQVTAEDADFSSWLTDYYFIPADQVADGVICYADGVEATEIAVLLLADEKACKTAEEALTEYIQNRASVFDGYAPQQAALARNGIAVVNGQYIALLICQDTSAAKTAFLGCFGENTESKNHTEAEFYDSEAILDAWKSGDDSSLSEMNRRILDAAQNVIQQEINDGMSDYEKELAIHDWITGWSSFDYSIFGRSSEDGFEAGSDTPYGVFIARSAMCHGYSSTFQLFMDMLDIECITVFGTPGNNGVEHSWNMVKLDGEWYCVDVAWDDPIGGNPRHTYFNVTSAYLRNGTIHRWDDSSVPEATAVDYAYESH